MATAKAAYFEREQAEMAEMEKNSGCTLTKDGEHQLSTNTLNKRSMVLDEETFEEQFLRCHVCKDRFNPTRMPKLPALSPLLLCHLHRPAVLDREPAAAESGSSL
nr:hypothetical protein BaRGS_025486 [Batillaria attramentaria]